MKPYYHDEDFGITIYLGDAREVLPTISGFDAVVTDPPYGIEFSGKNTKHTKRIAAGYSMVEDTPENVKHVIVPIVSDLIDSGVRVVMTPGIRNMFAYPQPKHVGSIYYPSGAGLGSWGFICSQPIFYYGADPYLQTGRGHRPDSMSTTESAPVTEHPCPKPLGTMKFLVTKASLPGETLLDPFMGSGTTLRAAKDLGRRAIGIEIEERYVEIAIKRLQQSVLHLEGVAS